MKWSSMGALWTSSILVWASPYAVAAEPPRIDPSTAPSSTPSPSASPPPAPEDSALQPSDTAPPEGPSTAEGPLPDKPAEPVTLTAPMALPQKGLPRLRIEADRPGVRLLRIDRVMSDEMGEGILVKTVCTAPCDQVIDGRKRHTFFFGADGMVPSRGFRLSRLDGDLVAHVRGGSIIARQTGFLFGGFGGVAVLGGISMLGVGYTRNDAHLSNEGKVVEGPNTNLTTGGFITLGVGAVMVTTAIILVLTAKTKITLMHAHADAEQKSARITFEGGGLRF
jgi:hypothetical protein